MVQHCAHSTIGKSFQDVIFSRNRKNVHTILSSIACADACGYAAANGPIYIYIYIYIRTRSSQALYCSHLICCVTAELSRKTRANMSKCVHSPPQVHRAAVEQVLGGSAYRSNVSGPPRPPCQEQRWSTVQAVQATLSATWRDPAIGEAQPYIAFCQLPRPCVQGQRVQGQREG